MPFKWVTIAIDERSGSPGEQDISARVDWKRTRPPQSALNGVDSGALALINMQKSPDAHVTNLVQIWQGWRDTVTREWDGSRDVFGYLVLDTEDSYRGARLDRMCSVVSYDYLLEHCPFLTWPTDLGAGEAAAGWPPGYTVRDWLIADRITEGAMYDGLMRFHFNPATWNFGGVAPVYNALRFTETIMPSMPTISEAELYGHFGFMGVKPVLDEIMKGAREVARRQGIDMRPAVGVQALAVGTQILKRFCAFDLQQDAQDMIPVARFSLNPGAGEYKMDSFRHRRGGGTIQTGALGIADSDKADGFIYSEAVSLSGLTTYPATDFRRPYWGGPAIHNSDITTQANMDAFVQSIADFQWGARGTITFATYCSLAIKVGDYVEVHFPSQGQNHHILPVISVTIETGNAGPIKKVLTVGERERDLGDILVPALDAPSVIRGTGTRERPGASVYTGPGAIGQPGSRSLSQIATTFLKNVMQGRHSGFPGVIIQGSPTAGPAVSVGAGPLTVPPPSPIAILTRVWDSVLGGTVGRWVNTLWTDHYGTVHAQGFFLSFTSDSTYSWVEHQRITVRSANMPSDTAQHGIVYTIVRNRAGVLTTVATVSWSGGAAVLSAAFEIMPLDEMQVTPVGVTGLSSLTLVSGDPL